jgi:hypothetical protein
MGEKKILRQVKYFGYKHFVTYIYNDPNAKPMLLVGDDYVVAINLTEIDHYVNKALNDRMCTRCKRRSNYFRAEINDGNIDNIICGNCDPTVKIVITWFKTIDPLI